MEWVRGSRPLTLLENLRNTATVCDTKNDKRQQNQETLQKSHVVHHSRGPYHSCEIFGLRTPTPHHRRRHPGLRRAEPFQKTFCNVLRCSVFRYASMVCDAPCRRRFENFMSICDDFVLAWVFVKSYKYSLCI